MAAASREQSDGVREINAAISTVETVTQRNASAAEELASTAQEMSGQAQILIELMAYFRNAEPAGKPATIGARRLPA